MKRLVAVAAAAVLVLPACGDDDASASDVARYCELVQQLDQFEFELEARECDPA